jgi:hypothetical protein
MKAQDQITATGQVTIRVTASDGHVKEERTIKNLVVTAGKTYIAGRMVGTPTAMSHMGIGSDNTSASVENTALGSQLGRVSLTSSTATAAVVTYVASFPAGTGTGAVVEAGVFNAASDGTMLCRTTFAVVNKGADDGMTITWAITIN